MSSTEFHQKRIRLLILHVMIAFDFENQKDLAKASLTGLKPSNKEYRRYLDLYEYCERMVAFQRKQKSRWMEKANQLEQELFKQSK
jgi:hypothetical protein